MSSRLNEFLKDAGLFVLTIGAAIAGFYIVMYSEQKAQDNDLTRLKAPCEAVGIKTAWNGTHETT